MFAEQTAEWIHVGITDAVTLPEFASTVQYVADTLGPFHAVIGHSLGGAATAFAAGWRDSRRFTTRGLGHVRILRDAGVIAEMIRFIGVKQR